MLHDSTYIRYLEQANSWRQKVEGWCSGAEEGRNGELLFNRYSISLCDDEKVLEVDIGDGHITLWM